ncbi:Bifunctional coenzyme A synthase [Oryzias melastigma]|uniref:Bifunctional coenzyme A synthase n=1 Tax=Oryzias melastigma TaxID=30732 RepID=A0A834FIJ3_ORYME|nr:Bifunctional coenzyme A synthase [Oryzias melastigma]
MEETDFAAVNVFAWWTQLFSSRLVGQDWIHEVWLTIIPEEEAVSRITERDGVTTEGRPAQAAESVVQQQASGARQCCPQFSVGAGDHSETGTESLEPSAAENPTEAGKDCKVMLEGRITSVRRRDVCKNDGTT